MNANLDKVTDELRMLKDAVPTPLRRLVGRIVQIEIQLDRAFNK
jgi:hypothetical protein